MLELLPLFGEILCSDPVLKFAMPGGEFCTRKWIRHQYNPIECVGNQQKWGTFVKGRSGGNGGVLGLP